MITCEHCDRTFKTKSSLSSHKHRFHGDMASKRNVVAIVNTPEEIPSRQNPRKVITSEDERREREDIEIVMNLSGSSSDSSISLFDDDKFSTNTKKRTRTPNSSDEEPPSKVSRKLSKKSDDEPAPKVQRNLSTVSSDDEGSVDVRVAKKKKLAKKRKRVSDSSDDEPAPKVQRNLSTVSSDDEGSVDVRVAKKKKLAKKRKRVSDSSDDDPPLKVHRKRSTPTDSDDYQIIMKKKPSKKRKRKVRRKRKYTKYTKSDKIIAEKDEEIDELKDSLKKETKRVKLYLNQLHSIENCDKRTPIEDILDNRVTLQQLNKINTIIKNGHADSIQLLIDDDEMLQTIQHLFVGLNSDVIPIANPQRIALTPEQKSFIRKFEAMDIVELRRYLEKNEGEKARHLLRILGIINDSLRLMCKSYSKYVGPLYRGSDLDE